MSNKYKVGDRVVCVNAQDNIGYRNGDIGSIMMVKDAGYRVLFDHSTSDYMFVYFNEIQPIKESNNMTEKTYTITLTELEAKVLKAICQQTNPRDEDGTYSTALHPIFYKLKGVENDGEYARLSLNQAHGQSAKPQFVRIKLNPAYSAEVSKDGVRVQHGELYSWDTVQALKDAVGKVGEGEWVQAGSVKEIVDAYAAGGRVEWTSDGGRSSDMWVPCSTIDYVPVGGKVRCRPKGLGSVSVPVGSYTAVVTKDSIKIGCQTFPTTIVDTLLANKPS